MTHFKNPNCFLRNTDTPVLPQEQQYIHSTQIINCFLIETLNTVLTSLNTSFQTFYQIVFLIRNIDTVQNNLTTNLSCKKLSVDRFLCDIQSCSHITRKTKCYYLEHDSHRKGKNRMELRRIKEKYTQVCFTG